MAKKKTKTERRDSAIKGWKTRRKLAPVKSKRKKNEKTRSKQAIPVSRKSNKRINRVKKHEPKKPAKQKRAKQKRSKNNSSKSASKRKQTRKSSKRSIQKNRSSTSTARRSTKTAKKKKTKKSTRTVSKRKSTKRIRKKKAKTKKRKSVTPGTPADKFYRKSNRTYFVTVKLASGKHERKRPLNVIVWAKDGLKNQEVIELLWAMIKRRKDKNLMFALDMELRELIVAQGPLTDRLQGYRQN